MLTRPLVGVYTGDAKVKPTQHVLLPTVFTTQVRPDLVSDVHNRMSKNKRQAHSVSKWAGAQTSAESWGTGRAVARIPRVPGGGTHRAGQAAFGNMCRGGRMFAPTKIWRRWHRKINITEKRFALASALAASAIPALLMARGHRVEQLPEVPLVIDTKIISAIDKSSKALALMKSVKAYDDVIRVKESRKIRPGKGKMRNRRYVQRRGPLVVYNEKGPLVNAFRNIPGVDMCSVNRLNLLQLAPGGHLGRFVIWTADAFAKLETIYGSWKRASSKAGYILPRPMMTNADLGRVINSDEIQSVLRPKKVQKRLLPRRNPLKNMTRLARLNPHAITHRRREIVAQEKRAVAKAKLVESKRKGEKVVPKKVDPKAVEKRKKFEKVTAPGRKKFTANLLAH